MTAAKHTPGPWSAAVDAAIKYAPARLHADREAFGQIRAIAEKADAERADLLAALERIRANTKGYDSMSTMGILCEIAGTALAKATGSAQ